MQESLSKVEIEYGGRFIDSGSYHVIQANNIPSIRSFQLTGCIAATSADPAPSQAHHQEPLKCAIAAYEDM